MIGFYALTVCDHVEVCGKFKVRVVSPQNDLIIIYRKGETYWGSYYAYVGFFGKEIKVGQTLKGDLCLWTHWNNRLEPRFESLSNLKRRGEKLCNK